MRLQYVFGWHSSKTMMMMMMVHIIIGQGKEGSGRCGMWRHAPKPVEPVYY